MIQQRSASSFSLKKTLVSRNGQECPLFDVVHPEFPLQTTASSNLQSALKYDFEETVLERDMPEPCQFPSPGRCRKRFLWTNKEVDLAPHPVVGLVLQD